MRNGGPFEELDETQKVLLRRPWFAYMQYCERKRFQSGKLTLNHDPAASWEQVRCPVLAAYGEKDATGPVDASATVIRQGLAKSGNRDLTVKVFPRADHLLAVSDTGGRKEAHERAKRRCAGDSPEFAPEYFDTVSGWLLVRFGPKRG